METVGEYRLESIIGTGTFGTVWQGTHLPTGETVAVKAVPRADPRIQEEIHVQRLLSRHENIVRFRDVVETTGQVLIVTEHVGGGDLIDHIVSRGGKLQEEEAKVLFRQLLAGVGHCHRHKIIHRDLKPENILLTPNSETDDAARTLKIIDFGLATEVRNGEPQTDKCGSLNYSAPELFVRSSTYEGPEVDCWSIGVNLYAMLTGVLPFDGESAHETAKLIRRGTYVQPGYLSANASDLIGRILVVDTRNRATLEEIIHHPWVCTEEPQSQLSMIQEGHEQVMAPMVAGIVSVSPAAPPSHSSAKILLEALRGTVQVRRRCPSSSRACTRRAGVGAGASSPTTPSHPPGQRSLKCFSSGWLRSRPMGAPRE